MSESLPVIALAAYRLAKAITQEEVGAPIRSATARLTQVAPRSQVARELDYLSNCIHCTCVHTAILVTAMSADPPSPASAPRPVRLARQVSRALVRALAAAALVSIAQSAVDSRAFFFRPSPSSSPSRSSHPSHHSHPSHPPAESSGAPPVLRSIHLDPSTPAET